MATGEAEGIQRVESRVRECCPSHAVQAWRADFMSSTGLIGPFHARDIEFPPFASPYAARCHRSKPLTPHRNLCPMSGVSGVAIGVMTASHLATVGESR